MGLNARERHSLDAIEYGLTDSDPALTILVNGFNRLADGEALPPWEEIRRPRMWGRSRPPPYREVPPTGIMCRQFRRPGRGLRWRLAWPLLWFAVSIALITVTLTLGKGGPTSACLRWAPVCSTQTRQPPGVHLGYKSGQGPK
jgi:hypothetical protein